MLVELSTAGDRELDDQKTGIVLAAREAMANAARFAGVERIYVLAEVNEEGARLVIRDKGGGFDLTSISDDRRGIKESIVGRVERVGGTASIHSAVGEGTEVDLYVGAQS